MSERTFDAVAYGIDTHGLYSGWNGIVWEGFNIDNIQFTLLSLEPHEVDYQVTLNGYGVCEPTSLLLGTGLGVIGLAAWRRRKWQASSTNSY